MLQDVGNGRPLELQVARAVDELLVMGVVKISIDNLLRECERAL